MKQGRRRVTDGGKIVSPKGNYPRLSHGVAPARMGSITHASEVAVAKEETAYA